MSATEHPTEGGSDSAVLAPYRGAGRQRPRRHVQWISLGGLVAACLVYGLLFGLLGPFILVMFPIPLAILAMVVVWALPETGRAPTTALEVLFFAFLAALILWPNYLAVALPGLPWLTLLRLIGVPMVLALLVSISVSARYRAELFNILRTAPWLWRLLVCFAVLQMISVGFSNRPFYSLQRAVIAQINWTAIFFVACYVFNKPGRARLWASILCLTAIPICLIVFLEYRHQQLPWAGHIPTFLKVQDESVQRILSGAYREGGLYRVQSTFSTPLGLGEYTALVMPFMLHFVMGPHRLYIRIAAALAVPVLIEVVLLTDSRLGLIGCFMSGLFYLLFWAVLLWKQRRESIFGPAITLAYPSVVALTFAATLLVGRIRERVWGSGQYHDSNLARKEMYEQGIPMILHRPYGYGAGMGGETLGFTNASGTVTIDTYYMLIGLDYGVVGFILYYGFILLAIYKSGKAATQVNSNKSEYMLLVPVAVAIFNYLIIKSVFSNDDNHPLVYMMIGMAVALTFRMNQEHGRPVEAPAAKAARLPGKPGWRSALIE